MFDMTAESQTGCERQRTQQCCEISLFVDYTHTPPVSLRKKTRKIGELPDAFPANEQYSASRSLDHFARACVRRGLPSPCCTRETPTAPKAAPCCIGACKWPTLNFPPSSVQLLIAQRLKRP